jgi:DNA-binding transcriptional regulator YiaG
MSEINDLQRIRRLAETGAARAIRESADVSLAEIADPVGVARSTIHRWEHGIRRPRGQAAIRYLRVLEELTGP